MKKQEKKQEQYVGILARIIFVIGFALFWQWYANRRNLMGFPPLDVIFSHLLDAFSNPNRKVLLYLSNSLIAILRGLGIGALLALILSSLSIASRVFGAIYNLVVAVFDLLPGVALLPILMITFGASDTSILILVIHSAVWPMSRCIIDGFRTIPSIYIEAGRNIGLKTSGLILHAFLPASLASVISGLKAGWARAWRGLIGAEMIFGAAQSAGIGVYISNARTVWIDYPGVYAALLLIIAVGVVMEYGIFQTIERTTVLKWGMAR